MDCQATHRKELYLHFRDAQKEAERTLMLRDLLHTLVRFLFYLLCRLEVLGLENIPPQGGAILAANHLSRLDSALVFAVVKRRDVTALVADTYRHNWLLRPLIEAVHGIWINREQADFQALRAARDYLRQGGLLGIAPEGTRSRSGALKEAKTGVAYLADKANVPVVPVALWGTETAVARLLSLRRPDLHIRFGQPFCLPPLAPGDRSAALQRNTDEIMCRIAALLPPAYRGVYADHPRLAQLLAQGSPV
jgi:1-acyl-sn-glycerol-3-phosphate acyltransferase